MPHNPSATHVVTVPELAKFLRIAADTLERQGAGLIRLHMELAELQAKFDNPPKHRFWGAGEPDCPREIKAGNGELHTLRCKVCGLDNPRDEICREQVAA
jgi:hypothetical protein